MKWRKIALVAIAATVIFHTLANFYILEHSRILRLNDEGGYIWQGVRDHNWLMNKQYKEFFTSWDGYVSRGLIGHVEGLILTFLSQFGLKDINLMILFTNAFFLSILLVSTYRIGSILYNPKIGLFSAVLLSLSPQILGHSRLSMIDLPLTAMVSLFLFCLIKTEDLRSLFFSIIAGIVLCLAEWTKEAALIFVFPISLFYFFRSLCIGEKRRQMIINFSIILLFTPLPLLAIYLTKNQYLLCLPLWKMFVKYNELDIFYYIKNIPWHYIGPMLFIVFIPAVFSYLYNIKRRNIFLSFCLFIPLLFFSIFPSRVSRFLMPALPPLFLLLTAEIFIRPFKAKRIYITVVIIFAILQFAIFSFFPNSLLPKNRMDYGLLSIEYDKDFYKVQKLIGIFKNEQPFADKENRVVSTFTSFHSALHYELALRNIPFDIDTPQDNIALASKRIGTVNWEKYLLAADYVLDKTGDLGRFKGYSEDVSGALKKALERNFDKFKKIDGFKIEDDDHIYLYKRIK